MKLVTYRASVEDAARLGVIVDDLVVDVAALGEAYGEDLPDSMLGLIDAGKPGLNALQACLDEADGDFPIHTATALANVRLLAPIPRPRKNIFGRCAVSHEFHSDFPQRIGWWPLLST